jgi:hypothetical protein
MSAKERQVDGMKYHAHAVYAMRCIDIPCDTTGRDVGCERDTLQYDSSFYFKIR